MGAWTVGRVSLDDGLAPNPGMSWDGDVMSLSGQLIGATQAAVTALRDQVRGLVDNRDEPTVPVTWEDDATIDGFYRVLGGKVGAVSGAAYSSFWFEFDLTLERVPGWQSPIAEVLRRGALRTNSISYTNDVATTGLPGGLRVPRWSAQPDGDHAYRTSDGGGVSVYADATDYEATVDFYALPSTAYGGAACIETSEDEGTTWRTVVGRQVANVPTWVRVSNGRARATITDSDGVATVNLGHFDPDNGDDGTWEETPFRVIDQAVTGSAIWSSYVGAEWSSPEYMDYVAASGVKWSGEVGEATNPRLLSYKPSGAGWTGHLSAASKIRGVSHDDGGRIWFASFQNDGVGYYSNGSATVLTNANFDNPVDLHPGPDGRMWVTHAGNNKITAIDTNDYTITAYTDANIDQPISICKGPDDRMWFTSKENDRIGAIATNGTVSTWAPSGVDEPRGICPGPDDRLWFTSPGTSAIGAIATNGTATTYTNGSLTTPRHIVALGSRLFFTDAATNTVGYCGTNGSITMLTAPGTLNSPQGIVADSNGVLWIASQGNNKMASLDPTPLFAAVPPPLELEFGGTLTVMRNGPEAVSVRVGSADRSDLMDVTLRRGANYVEGFCQSDTNRGFGLRRAIDEDATIISGGIQATSADTNGNQFMLLAPGAVTETTNGQAAISLTSAASTFAWGASASSADTVEGTATVPQAYFAAVSHRQIIAAR